MARRFGSLLGLMLVLFSAAPVAAATEALDFEPITQLSADLEGVPIPLTAVGKLYCDDFDYPAIHCYGSADGLTAAVSEDLTLSLLSSSDYVQVYSEGSFAGYTLIASQDYPALSLIGWNDRISSFRAKNWQTGTFYTDWFAGGTAYGFCCNQQVPSLGGFNDTFSSIYNN